MGLGAPTLPATLERAVLAALFGSTLACGLLVSGTPLEPFQHPLSFGLIFWGWLAAFYVSTILVPAVAVWCAARLLASRWRRAARLPRLLLGGASLAFLVASLVLNRPAVAELAELGEPERFRRLLPIASGLAAVGLLTAALVPLSSRAACRLLAVAAAGTSLVALLPARAPAPTPPVLAGALTGQRVLVVGLDGADWSLAEPLMDRGELPVLAGLRARGAWGELETLRPTLSPEIWTTIFTGSPPARHGIIGFAQPRIRGARAVLPELRPPRGAGFDMVEAALRRRGIIHDVPANSDMRRVPAYWNLSSAYATPLNVISIWPTWPAEEITGTVVTERVALWPAGGGSAAPERVTYPASLYDEIARWIVRPEDLGAEVGARFIDAEPADLRALRDRPQAGGWDAFHQWDRFVSRHETVRQIGVGLMGRQRALGNQPADTLIWFDLVDKLCHMALRCSELVEPLDCPEGERRRLSGMVSEAYRTADSALGELIAVFGEGNVIVLSDHGWARDRHPRTPAYSHRNSPPGIFVAAGPAFGQGEMKGLTVFEILPLLLRLKGFAVADDLPGRPPERVFSDAFLASNPAVSIPSYGPRGALIPVSSEGSKDAEVMEQLRGIGYIE